jgi:TonB family protein
MNWQSTNAFSAARRGIGRNVALVALSIAAAFVATLAQIACAAETLGNDAVKSNDLSLPHVTADRTGAIPTKETATLHLTADLGSVRIISLPPGASPEVRYAVHIETDARSPLAEHLLDRYALTVHNVPDGVEITGTLPPQLSRASSSGAQFWVEFEVAIPRGYNVEVKTDAGDIQTQDIGGAAQLVTQGGNIRTGRIGTERGRDDSTPVVAKLETEGGHIQVADVAGDLNAFTAGGHINAGNIAGDAHLHSGGGHIRAEHIRGRADLETDGGNITIGQAGSFVAVRTGGGQIDFGEVRGSVRAQTGGGGIRIMYVSGPLEVESSAGSICLTRVAGTVRAATAGGTIRAWINPDAPSSRGTVHLAGSSQLTSGKGDIVVFLPRNLAADIDAFVESGGEHKIDADPALALAVQQTPGAHGASLHASAKLNGGGPPLKLRTNSGTIRLQFLDSEIALRESLIREQRERLTQYGVQLMPAGFDVPEIAQVQPEAQAPEDKGDWLENWINRMEIAFWGGTREDPEEFRKHLVSWPSPPYPEIAQKAGVQGLVRLEVRATKDGRVEVLKLIEGSPTLADAAISTMKFWRVSPSWVSAKKGDVISTVTFNFQLQH